MSRSVDRAIAILRDRLERRGLLDVVERLAAHHGVTIYDVFAWCDVADKARRDVAKALAMRGLSSVQLGDLFCADLDEVMGLMVEDRDQKHRLAAALGWGSS